MDEEKQKIENQEEQPAGKKSEVEKLKEQLTECEKLRDEYLAGWQRQKADFLNFQKEIARKAEEMVKFANEDLIREILIVLDSFDISVNSFKIEGLTEAEKRMVQGMELIKSQLEDILKSKGLEPIETKNQKFNPELHEAIAEVEGEEEGMVADEVVRGYKLNGKVIRPSKVKVIKHKNNSR